MSENHRLRCRCNGHQGSFHSGHSGHSGSGRSFFLPNSRVHYAPDLPIRLEHIALDVSIDPEAKTLKGWVRQRLRVVAPDSKFVRLDQEGLTIDEVQVSGKPARFEATANGLRVELASPAQSGDAIELAIRYHVTNPRRGLYFIAPDADYPDKLFQAWTQGQDEYSHFWFPVADYPNQKTTSEVIVTVPKKYTAVSNGALVSRTETDQGARFHYKLGQSHVVYLIAIAVGEFTQWQDQGPRGLPVQYFVPAGREADGKRAFGQTPKMIEAFEKKVGVPYPYEKYSQVAVQDFIYGGMENTSATTQTDLTLHDARAHLDFTSDSLVSHELAHQWFGDLVTCRDWSHGWLNEGFATFMERVWIECDTGPDGGWDEAKYYAHHDLLEYLDEDRSRYRRAIVCNHYVAPSDLFDTHLYHKGALVLNLVRGLLGEEPFWKAVQLYLTRHRGGNVETIDLIRAIEDSSGRNLRRVFDEWVYLAGYPEFEIAYTWHEDRKQVEIAVEQKQTGGQPLLYRDGATTPLFHLPVKIELTLEGDHKITERIELGEARDRIFLTVPGKPLMVRFDPENWVPKTLKFPRPKEMLLHQLEKDADCMGRIEAARELAKVPEADVIAALARAAKGDRFWGVQAEAAGALAEIRSEAALEALIDVTGALGTGSPKARRAAVKALGGFRDPRAAALLRRFAEKDPSYFVESEATHSWTAAMLRRLPAPDPKAIEEIERFLLAQLEKPSYREVIRSSALRSFALLPGIGQGERPGALKTLVDWSRRSKPIDARTTAITTLGSIARVAAIPERARIGAILAELADEPEFRIRRAVVAALEGAEDSAGLASLEKVRAMDADPRVQRMAQVAAMSVQAAGTVPESVNEMKSSLERLEEEHRKLKSQLEELKAASEKR